MDSLQSEPIAPAAGTLRLFIALELPGPALEALARLSGNLQKGSRFAGCLMRWSAPEQLHLTLAFPGEQPAAFADAIGPALADLAARYAPQRLELRGLGVFPHWKRPTVLWAGIRDRSHALARLHADLNRSLEAFGIKAEANPFRPHVTLARFKDYRNLASIEKLVHDHSQGRIAPFEADRLTLFKSERRPGGAAYSPLASHRLAALPPKEEPHEGIHAA